MVNAHLFFYCNSFKKNLDVEEIALILTLAQHIESRTFFVFQLQLISHCRFLSQFYSIIIFLHSSAEQIIVQAETHTSNDQTICVN